MQEGQQNFEIVGFENHAGLVSFWSFPVAFRVFHQTVDKTFTLNQDIVNGICEKQVPKPFLWAREAKNYS